MIIVDKALQARQQEGNPIRVAMVGAGYMGRGIAFQMLTAVEGMRLVAIGNRTVEKARRAYLEAGVDSVAQVSTVTELDEAIVKGRYVVTDDPLLLCRAEPLESL